MELDFFPFFILSTLLYQFNRNTVVLFYLKFQTTTTITIIKKLGFLIFYLTPRRWIIASQQ
jgi:hypothetical protein